MRVGTHRVPVSRYPETPSIRPLPSLVATCRQGVFPQDKLNVTKWFWGVKQSRLPLVRPEIARSLHLGQPVAPPMGLAWAYCEAGDTEATKECSEPSGYTNGPAFIDIPPLLATARVSARHQMYGHWPVGAPRAPSLARRMTPSHESGPRSCMHARPGAVWNDRVVWPFARR
jgi:hypothetical protein